MLANTLFIAFEQSWVVLVRALGLFTFVSLDYTQK